MMSGSLIIVGNGCLYYECQIGYYCDFTSTVLVTKTPLYGQFFSRSPASCSN